MIFHAEYIPPPFWLDTPFPFFRRLTRGLLSRKIFFDFYFSDFARNLRMVGLRIFFEFYTRYSYLEKFFYFFKTLLQLIKFSLGIPYQLLSFLVLYLSDFDLEFTSSRLRFSTLIIILDSVYFDSEFRLVFTRWILLVSIYVDSTLWLFCLL